MNLNLIILIVGVIMVVEGIPYFLFPNSLRKIFQQIVSFDTRILRFMGLVFILTGLLIVYLIKSKVCP